jgi:hypothetical protein
MMTKTIQFLTAILVLISLSSCDELTDVHFNTSMTERIPVHIDQTQGSAVSFNESVILNLDNDDTHDYLNSIKDIEINGLTYKLIDFSGDIDGTIDVQFYIGVNPLLQNSITVKPTVDNATVFEITDVQELNTIATAFKNGHQVTARYQGTALCNDDNMDFKVEVNLEVDVTADPI